MPKVSVIIPVFNVAQYLERCLDSLIHQTLKDIEIICIDDCSTDNSLEILHNYANKDSRVKVIAFDTKQNAAIARNAGLKVATGEYLGFVDSDDFVDLDFYEKLYNKAIETDADIVKASTLIVNVDGSLRKSNLNDVIRQNKMNFTGQWGSAIYRHEMIQKEVIRFPNECPKAQDIVFLNRCLIAAKKIELLDEPYYHYIRRKNSLDAQKLPDVNLKSEIQAIQLILADLNKNYPNRLNKDEYLSAYTCRLKTFINSFFRTDSKELKETEAHCFLEGYQKCLAKDTFFDILKLPIFEKWLIEKDFTEMMNSMIKYSSFDEFYRNQVLFMLRKNIKNPRNK